MCLVAHLTEFANTIVIIRSLVMPLVLRQVNDGHFLVIGPWYVHGLMENQTSELFEEIRVRIVIDEQHRTGRPNGAIRQNGKKMDAWKYEELLPLPSEQWINLI